jgi:hypothetical protein
MGRQSPALSAFETSTSHRVAEAPRTSDGALTRQERFIERSERLWHVEGSRIGRRRVSGRAREPGQSIPPPRHGTRAARGAGPYDFP